MLVRERDGFYAGQIREFPSEIALQLIANGRGEDPFAETANREPRLSADAVPGLNIEPSPAQQPHARKRSR